MGIGGEDGRRIDGWRVTGGAAVSSTGSQGPLSSNVDDEGLGFVWPKFRSVF